MRYYSLLGWNNLHVVRESGAPFLYFSSQFDYPERHEVIKSALCSYDVPFSPAEIQEVKGLHFSANCEKFPRAVKVALTAPARNDQLAMDVIERVADVCIDLEIAVDRKDLVDFLKSSAKEAAQNKPA